MSDGTDAGFDEWLDAAADGSAYYLACPNGHGSLPPRRVCPTCGALELEERTLPDVGEVETFTVTHVPTPSFDADAPYATVIASFGPIRVTGQVPEAELDALERGLPVGLAITVSETTGDRVVTFQPQ